MKNENPNNIFKKWKTREVIDALPTAGREMPDSERVRLFELFLSAWEAWAGAHPQEDQGFAQQLNVWFLAEELRYHEEAVQKGPRKINRRDIIAAKVLTRSEELGVSPEEFLRQLFSRAENPFPFFKGEDVEMKFKEAQDEKE